MESVDGRKIELLDWLLSSCGLRSVSVLPMVGDASTRRYFRVLTPEKSYVAMDATPPHANCATFVAVADALRKKGITVPEIFFSDIERGYLLMTDFGDDTYLQKLDEDNADELYGRALETLASMQEMRDVPHHPVPPFTKEFMQKEWAWCKEWYLGKMLKMTNIDNEKKIDECYNLVVEAAAEQPQVFMHRDFHSANLMVLPNDGVGVLDFQDAFIGPVTYDLVSLLRDCYVSWPDKKVESWVNAYRLILKARDSMDIDQATFMRWFDFMGVQRHLKALYTFASKHVRDNQPRYLVHIPRTLFYLVNTTEKYPELAALNDLLQTVREMSDRCVA